MSKKRHSFESVKTFLSLFVCFCMLVNILPNMGMFYAKAEEGSVDSEEFIEDDYSEEEIFQISVGSWNEWDDMTVQEIALESEEAKALMDMSFGVQVFSMESAFSGNYGDQMVGFEAEFYEALSQMTETNDTVSIEYTLQEGETAQEIFNLVSASSLKIALAYTYDHPENTLWFETVQLGASYNSTWIRMQMKFPVAGYYSAALGEAAMAAAANIVNGLQGTTRYEKLREMHDFLVDDGEYDEPALDLERGDEHFFYAHSALGILLHHTGVCESYAKSFKILCNMVGIPCYIVTSATHAWNYVLMPNGQWYMIDCTYDDPIGWNELYGPKPIYYDYFLVSNDPPVDNRAHVPEARFSIPVTAATAYDPEVDDPADEPVEEDPEIVVEGCSLTLNGIICLNFYLDLDERLSASDYYVTFTQNDIVTELIPLDENACGNNRYKLTYDVAAKEINDTITLKLYASDGSLVPLTKEESVYEDGYAYSVNAYIEKALVSSDTTEDLKQLARSLQTYGDCAQQYFGYGENNAVIEIADNTMPDLADYQMVASGSVNGVSYFGSSLLLKNMTTLRHYFAIDGEADLDNYSFFVGDTEVDAVRSGNLCYVQIEDFAAQDMDQMPEIVIKMNDSTQEYQLIYGPLSYARQTLGRSSDEGLKMLMKAMVQYWQSAKDYFNK